MNIWEALKVVAEDPLELIGGLLLMPLGFAIMWIGFYLIGCN